MFSLGALQAANLAIPLLMLPFLARTLGLEKLGLMVFAMSLMQVFVILTDYGFNLTASRDASIHRENIYKLSRLFITVTTLRIAFMITGFMVIFIAVNTIPKLQKDASLYIASYVIVVGNALFPLWLFQGLEKVKLVSAIQICSKIFAFSIMLLIVSTPDDVIIATLLHGSGSVLAALISLPLLPQALGHHKISMPTFKELKSEIMKGWDVFISTAFISFYTSSNVFVLGLFTTPEKLALYHVAEKTARAIAMGFNPISQALYPHISKIHNEAPHKALILNRKALLFTSSTGLIAGVVLYSFSEQILALLFGNNFKHASELLEIMAILPFLLAITSILSISTMLGFGRKQAFSKIAITAGIIHFAAFIPLAWMHESIGAAWAHVLVELLVTIIVITYLSSIGINPLLIKNKPIKLATDINR